VTALIASIMAKTPLFYFPMPFEVAARGLTSASSVSNGEQVNGERPFPCVAAPASGRCPKLLEPKAQTP